MGGSGESVDAENDKGTAQGGVGVGGSMKEKQDELSSLHGYHLWAFFTAGGQMK